MLNKFTVFSVVTVVGLFNIAIYVLFIQPGSLGPHMASLVSLDSVALAFSQFNGSSSERSLTPESASTLKEVKSMDVRFVDRTLMQSSSAAIGDNASDHNRVASTIAGECTSGCNNSGSNPTHLSTVVIGERELGSPLQPPAIQIRSPSNESSTNTSVVNKNNSIVSVPVTETVTVTSSPLRPPPTSVTTTSVKKNANVNSRLKIPTSTVIPPPLPRIDAHNYSYIINQKDVCTTSTKTANTEASEQQLLVVFVCAAAENFARRQAIRETWGSVVYNRTLGVRLLFLLGAITNKSIQQRVADEAANYSDIVQEDFLDTYNNLTIKSVMMLKWVERFCPRVKFVLKTDDDSFINVRNLIKYLHLVKKRKRMLFGRLVRGARPVRLKTSKWYAPVASFRERVYPDYLSGSAYAMSVDVARALFNASLHTPLFHLEDVFITGMCARKAGVSRRHHSGFVYDRRPTTGCAFKNAISGHRVTPDDMRKIWDELQHKNLTSCR